MPDAAQCMWLWLQSFAIAAAAQDRLKMHIMEQLPWVVIRMNALLLHAMCFMVQPCMHCNPPGSINVKGQSLLELHGPAAQSRQTLVIRLAGIRSADSAASPRSGGTPCIMDKITLDGDALSEAPAHGDQPTSNAPAAAAVPSLTVGLLSAAGLWRACSTRASMLRLCAAMSAARRRWVLATPELCPAAVAEASLCCSPVVMNLDHLSCCCWHLKTPLKGTPCWCTGATHRPSLTCVLAQLASWSLCRWMPGPPGPSSTEQRSPPPVSVALPVTCRRMP